MDGRQERGRALARAQGPRIRHIEGPLWFVPSETGNGGYLVDVEAGACTCPDQAERCKHLHAVEAVRALPVPLSAPALAAAPVPPPAPAKVPRSDLTPEEQKHVREALKFLRARHGWDVLAKGTRFAFKSLYHVAYGQTVSASMAVRLARFAGVGVDDVLSGKFPPTCPHCGQKMPAQT